MQGTILADRSIIGLTHKDNNDDTSFTAIFQGNLGMVVPEVFILDFIEAKDDWADGNNWSYKACKGHVKSNQQCHSTKGRKYHSHPTDLLTPSLTGSLPTLSFAKFILSPLTLVHLNATTELDVNII